MKNIKKNATIKSKVKGKETPFNVDLNYSEEYDSFNIKVKKGEGFMSYTDSLQGLPLEVVQKLNEMLEEVLIKAGSEYEMKEHKMSNSGDFQAGVYNKGGRFEDFDGIGYAKTKGKESVNWDKELREYAGSKYSKLTEKEKKEIISDMQRDWDISHSYAKGGSLQAHGIEVGDTFVKTISGGIQKVKDKNGKIVYIDLSNGERDLQPPLPFADGGGIGIEEDIDMTDDNVLRVRKPAMPERKLSNLELAEKHNSGAYEYMGKDKMMAGGKVHSIKVGDFVKQKGSNVRLLVTDVGNDWRSGYDYITVYNDVTRHTKTLVDWSDYEKSKYATGGALVGNQKRIDLNKNGKIDAEDFKLLRSSMNGAWRNERKHVNHSEDYEVRYAKPRPNRTGYKGKRKFGDGGGISNFERLSRVVAKNYEGKRVKPKYQNEYGKVYSKSEAKEVGNKVAGKVKLMKKAESGTEVKKGNRGGVMLLAKKIRRDGEKWTDAVKRASQELK